MNSRALPMPMPMPMPMLMLMLIAACTMSACREDTPVVQHRVVGGDTERGRQALVRYGCGGCHAIPGVPAAAGLVGPSMRYFADRVFIAGRIRNEPTGLVAWIRDPQLFDPSTAMPDLDVTDADARDMAAYLYTLGADRLGPPHLVPAKVLSPH